MIGVSIVLLYNILHISRKSSKIGTIQKNVNTILKTTNIPNEELSDVNDFYKKLAMLENKFFTDMYTNRFKKLKCDLASTINNRSISLSVKDMQNNTAIQPMIDQMEGYYSATCTCNGINWWLTESGGAFISFIHNRIAQKNPHKIRRIFIYDSEQDLKDHSVQIAFCLHNNISEGYEFRAISRKVFNSVFTPLREEHKGIDEDFGIFGDKKFVWGTTMRTNIHDIKSGTLTMNTSELDLYKDLFETSGIEENIITM
ncbi:MAG: hypothetical protein FWC33_03680 [Candidatus Bathyarchaeota archaeon]|nr:hypothetical protein [Candidatus Termiticorpusculum sp.]